MGIEVLIPLLAVFSIFFIPIAGLTFILTTRFALKPLVETLARALRESGQGPSPDLYLRLQDLTDTVDALRNEVQTLREVQDFDKKLLGPMKDRTHQGKDRAHQENKLVHEDLNPSRHSPNREAVDS